MLGDKDPISGLYCPGLRIDETDRVLAAGRAHGTTESDFDFFPCDTCTGPDGNPIAGYQATIIGTVKELGDGMGRVTGAPGTRSVVGTPVLTNVQVLDSMVGCDPNMMVSVEADVLGNECLIRSAVAAAVDIGSPVMDDTLESPPAATTTTTVPPVISLPETTPPAAIEEEKDCSSDFCQTTLTDGYALKYKINEAEATITMEVTYDGEAWLGIAFSEDERMGESDGIL